jgi:hypothetical protein
MTDLMHWRRFDGSFDSICVICRATIANSKDEADLAEYERSHVCPDMPFSRRIVQGSPWPN